MIAALLAAFTLAVPHWPRLGIHTGDNKLVWEPGCCDGDLVVLDFRDEQADGNQGHGLLTLTNSSSGEAATYEITPFYGLWKSFGPFCAPHGQHTLSFTSDAQPGETSVSIIDSFGLVRGKGGMHDMPITFNTSYPSRFCFEDDLMESCHCGDEDTCKRSPCVKERQKERARKIFAYSMQFKSRTELAEAGYEEDCPYDVGYSVLEPPQ